MAEPGAIVEKRVTEPTAEDEMLLCQGLAAQSSRIGGRFPNAPSQMHSMRRHEIAKYGIIGRAPHSIGDPDPDRKRELGEVEIDPGTEQRRTASRMIRKLARRTSMAFM